MVLMLNKVFSVPYGFFRNQITLVLLLTCKVSTCFLSQVTNDFLQHSFFQLGIASQLWHSGKNIRVWRLPYRLPGRWDMVIVASLHLKHKRICLCYYIITQTLRERIVQINYLRLCGEAFLIIVMRQRRVTTNRRRLCLSLPTNFYNSCFYVPGRLDLKSPVSMISLTLSAALFCGRNSSRVVH